MGICAGRELEEAYGQRGPNRRPGEPVVHLAYRDAMACATWRGGRLPTEANTWQGVFPLVNRATDGFAGIAPVGCFQPNAFGLYDMIGNVWEMTSDFYAAGHDPSAQPVDTR